MKTILFSIIALLSLNLHAQEIKMDHFPWTLNDVSEKGLTKEELFKQMDRDTIVSSSICANRALMWLYEFKEKHDIDGSKIFVFYTDKKTGFSLRTWWYHVAPIINEKGNEFVMDAGFPGSIKGPVTVDQWLKNFVGSNNCHEISPNDSDLIQMMYEGHQYPQETYRGKFDCYYVKAPAGLWFPGSVANALNGKASHNEIDKDEVYSACREASTSPIGGLLRLGKKKCKKFIGEE